MIGFNVGGGFVLGTREWAVGWVAIFMCVCVFGNLRWKRDTSSNKLQAITREHLQKLMR